MNTMNAIYILKTFCIIWKVDFVTLFIQGLLVPKRYKELKKIIFYIFFLFVKIILITLSFYQILDMGIILCENTYVDKEINV